MYVHSRTMFAKYFMNTGLCHINRFIIVSLFCIQICVIHGLNLAIHVYSTFIAIFISVTSKTFGLAGHPMTCWSYHGPIIFYRTGSPVRKVAVGYWSKPFRINDRQYTRRYIFPRSLKLVSYVLLVHTLFSPE
jgi:hypothetical protein